MAIETRGKAVYYYRSQRTGTKVKRKYVASGDDARLAAAVAKHRRLGKRMKRETVKAVWDGACAPLDELIAVTDLLFIATLLVGGFHQHHQGEWRRRREQR